MFNQKRSLLEASRNGNTEEIVAIVRAGADVNARGEGGETALSEATIWGADPHQAAARVRCLLSLGALVGSDDPFCGLGTSVHNAARNGYVAALKELLSRDGAWAFTRFNQLGHSSLIAAVRGKHLEAANLLLEAGAPIDARDETTNSHTALGYAVQQRDIEMVKLLLEFGADPDVRGWMNLSPVELSESDSPTDDPILCANIQELLLRAKGERRP